MAKRNNTKSGVVFRSVSKQGKGEMRRCEGSDDLWQIRCVYVDPDWSEPWSLDFIREHYCYEGAKCVIGLASASQKRDGDE
jgi:hypothetical protein